MQHHEYVVHYDAERNHYAGRQVTRRTKHSHTARALLSDYGRRLNAAVGVRFGRPLLPGEPVLFENSTDLKNHH